MKNFQRHLLHNIKWLHNCKL